MDAAALAGLNLGLIALVLGLVFVLRDRSARITELEKALEDERSTIVTVVIDKSE